MGRDQTGAACGGFEKRIGSVNMANGTTAQWLTPKEIVAELGVHYDSFRRKLRRGEGPKFKRYGARYLIRRDWYDKWIEEDNKKCSA